MKGRILVPGRAVRALALVLTHPISFWGGVEARTGRIGDPRHPQHGECVAGKALFLPATIGSSSASAVLMELVHTKAAPAAIIMHEPDAILLLGLIVAREMGWPTPPAVRLDRSAFAQFTGRRIAIDATGTLRIE